MERTTNREAARMIWHGVSALTVNVARATDGFVHRSPWMVICLILIASFVASYVGIASARAERDSVGLRMYHLEQKYQNLKNMTDAYKGISGWESDSTAAR